jgi:hypothetical protein
MPAAAGNAAAAQPERVTQPSAPAEQQPSWLSAQVTALSERSQGMPLPMDKGPVISLIGRSVAFVLLAPLEAEGDTVRVGLHTGR